MKCVPQLLKACFFVAFILVGCSTEEETEDVFNEDVILDLKAEQLGATDTSKSNQASYETPVLVEYVAETKENVKEMLRDQFMEDPTVRLLYVIPCPEHPDREFYILNISEEQAKNGPGGTQQVRSPDPVSKAEVVDNGFDCDYDFEDYEDNRNSGDKEEDHNGEGEE